MAWDRGSEHLMVIVLAGRVHRVNLFEVHAFKELQIDVVFSLVTLSNVEDLVRGHALTALLRGWFQTGDHFCFLLFI